MGKPRMFQRDGLLCTVGICCVRTTVTLLTLSCSEVCYSQTTAGAAAKHIVFAAPGQLRENATTPSASSVYQTHCSNLRNRGPAAPAGPAAAASA